MSGFCLFYFLYQIHLFCSITHLFTQGLPHNTPFLIFVLTLQH